MAALSRQNHRIIYFAGTIFPPPLHSQTTSLSADLAPVVGGRSCGSRSSAEGVSRYGRAVLLAQYRRVKGGGRDQSEFYCREVIKEVKIGCIFALVATFAPRLALIIMWIFTDYVSRAFTTWVWPLLGVFFLPFTTLVYCIVYVPVIGVVGSRWAWVILAFLIDILAYGGSGYTNRDRIPGGH
jgi:hypothetical protein